MRHGPRPGDEDGDSVHHLLRSRFGLRRKKGLCFGKAGTDDQEDMSLSIYYQAILSPWRKALTFLIYGDSHLGSISFSHFVTPTWKETKRLSGGSFAKEQAKRGDVEMKTSLAFLGVGARDTQLFPSCGGSHHRIRNTHANVSAVVHFLFMLIASVGNLVHASISLPIPVLDTVPRVSNHWRLKLSIEEIE